MTTPNKKILITTALPYANGPLHLGNLVENVQADIWKRWHRLLGHECIFICGDDAHGTPIMINAEKQGITPEALVEHFSQEHQADFRDFLIDFDNYYTTHSPENRELSAMIYERLLVRGDITTRTIEQAFDPVKNMFLPDRYVKGECPRCHNKDQYGDNCENCGATYSPAELINPISVISGAKPIQKESVHYFFNLENYTEMLKEWMHSGSLQEQVANKLAEWFVTGLQPWDISRDAPYFGFEIPDAPGKYFYVWLDAPIGYMASFKNLCAKRNDLSFEAFWKQASKHELYHFLGKDVVYFHALFWPAMLAGSGFRLPSAVFTHGYLTINGQKMSKSRGTFITARQYLQYLDPEYLRYYFAAKLNNRIEDIDLNLMDFQQRINADLVGKVINIASRCAGFITKLFEGRLGKSLVNSELWNFAIESGHKINELYLNREYHLAVREIMNIADRTNQYIDEIKPWTLAKQPENEQQVQDVCTMGLNLFKIIMLYLKPILPKTAIAVENFLNTTLEWQTREQPLVDHVINPFQPLMQRIDSKDIEQLTQT